MEFSPTLLNVHISLRGRLRQVIEPLLRSEVDLPKRVSQHLHQVEIRIVESLAWASDSPLWDDMKANEGGLPSCKQVRSTMSTHGAGSSLPQSISCLMMSFFWSVQVMMSSQPEEPNTVLGIIKLHYCGSMTPLPPSGRPVVKQPVSARFSRGS